MLRAKEDNATNPLRNPSAQRVKTHPHPGPYPSHARHSSEFGRISWRTGPPSRARGGPIFPIAHAWSGRAEILEHALEQTKQSFTGPETWVVPRADSSVGDRDSATYIMPRVSRTWPFRRPRILGFFSRRNGCNDQLDRHPRFAHAADKNGLVQSRRFSGNTATHPHEVGCPPSRRDPSFVL